MFGTWALEGKYLFLYCLAALSVNGHTLSYATQTGSCSEMRLSPCAQIQTQESPRAFVSPSSDE
jgi:hypothetical protein